ncbi:MAG: Uracil-DNA glycosylase [Chlamydiales bacterium]|nr:Uracil-DNA glycosylase [Chlamydiales bacterium]MCH9619572.1 Uracil-DNA glycosylase [Chlamydiales bacterium]MCH9623178.1 Uracil-DNA glycosylase [Chlamydiales bacterium]
MSIAPPQLKQDWKDLLKDEWEKPYMLELAQFVAKERKESPVFPSKENVFSALNMTSYEATKVVIVGQDPYHGEGQAHGLSFSVPKGIKPPPSLKNIFKEIEKDLGITPPEHGCLEEWAKQGVLLLNAVLTVRSKSPGSHRGKGWELFTDAIIQALCKRSDPVIFVLWGRYAQEKCSHILDQSMVLKAAHPSPYSAYSGFFGCQHFSKINNLLKTQGKEPIEWDIS